MPTGILTVAYPLRERARAILPPEHRIIAIKDEGRCQEQWMIEGPLMPGGAKPVRLLIMLKSDEDVPGEMVLMAKFDPVAVGYDDVYWVIDRWPHLDAFRIAHGMERL